MAEKREPALAALDSQHLEFKFLRSHTPPWETNKRIEHREKKRKTATTLWTFVGEGAFQGTYRILFS